METKLENKSHFQIVCTGCGRFCAERYSPLCPDCGSMIDIAYDLRQVQFYESDNPFHRFQDLLPLRDPSLLPEKAAFTPTVHAKTLGRYLGMPWLYLKNETVWPTGTTKYRQAAVALPFLHERGVRDLCLSSTGNSSTAFAYFIAKFPDIKLYIFTASKFIDRVHYQPGPQITHFALRGATFVEAFDYVRIFAKYNKFTPERGFFNPGRRDGLRLAWLEAVEQVNRPLQWYAQATSSAMGVYGVNKAACDLLLLGRSQQMPRLLCVQQETCSPMARAWEAGSDVIRSSDIFARPSGIAKAVLRGNPTRTYPHIRRIVKDSEGEIVAVSENEIREARRIVEECEGIYPSFSAATAVAGVIKLIRSNRLPKDDSVLVNLTGGDRDFRPVSNDVHWLKRDGNTWILENPNSEIAKLLPPESNGGPKRYRKLTRKKKAV